VPSARNTHAVVGVNGQTIGVYLLSEVYDDNFMENWYGPGENYVVWEPNYGDFNYDANNWDCEEGPCDPSIPNYVGDILGRTASDANYEELKQYLDVDSVLKLMIIEMAVGDWDGYCASHNYRVLYNPYTGLLDMSISSMDLILGYPGGSWPPSMTSCRAMVYNFCKSNTNCTKRWNELLEEGADVIEEIGMAQVTQEEADLIEADMISQPRMSISSSAFTNERDSIIDWWQNLPDYLRSQAN